MLIELIAVALIVLILTLLAGWLGMPLLGRLNVGQRVRDDGPASHFKKSGTPTFGGLFFLIPIMLLGIFAIFADSGLRTLSVLVLFMLLFAAVGFYDDFIKVRINKKGLTARQKTILQGLLCVLFTAYYLWLAPEQPFFLVPFYGQVAISGWISLPYAVFVVLYLYFVCNAVNITDGVDGLSSSVTAVCTLAMAAAGLLLSSGSIAARPAAWLAAAILGGCLGFLVFNRHPARVFMGDTGSQALGIGVASIALLYGAPWLLLLMGVIYIAEAMSVVIQVAYFKKTGGKRIFRMSPLHHHYELGGWHENKIVITFTLVTVAGSLIGLLLLL